jgi:hypothetical protein
VLYVNGAEAGWMAPYRRNAESISKFDVALNAGDNRIEVFFDDLAERDARYYIQLDYRSGPDAVAGIPAPPLARAIETALATMHFDAPSYTSGTIALTLPQPMPEAVKVAVKVEGDFMSHQAQGLKHNLPPSPATSATSS